MTSPNFLFAKNSLGFQPLSPALRVAQPPQAAWDRDMGPARALVLHAERRALQLGHENAGFLSIERGFVPRQDPRLKLDSRFAAWDETAAQLPELYQTLSVRRTLDNLPVLDASPNSMEDADVLRATSMLAILAHAYWYCQPKSATQLPESIVKPWAQLRARLGRRQEVISYIDLIVYNWQRKDPNGPLTVENLRLLFPTIGNQEEEVFYLTQLEILDRCSKIVRALLDAQDAVVCDTPAALEIALLQVADGMNAVVREALPKIDPNPHSGTYVDAVTWAKTVAPFAVPIHAGDLGPSGTSSPIFNTLDIFFGRKDHRTFLGREIKQLQLTYPPVWRAFLFALSRVNIAEYVARVDNPSLCDALSEANDTYTGTDGFLGRHRMKVYGFLELAFKVGRAVTIGGFGGAFKDRTWDEVDDELGRSHRERQRPNAAALPQARVVSVTPSSPTPGAIHQIKLEVCEGKTVRYEAGDRIAIWPTHSATLVERTLQVLGASGNEELRPTAEWQQALIERGLSPARVSLRSVLAYGALRPVLPRVAEALHATSQNDWLLNQLQSGKVQDLELWQVLEQLSADGFSLAPMLDAGVGNTENSSALLCQLIAPERPRVYSISSCPPDNLRGTRSIELTVRQLVYPGTSTPSATLPEPTCSGTASTFLVYALENGSPFPFQIRKSTAFQLPRSNSTPVVLFAAGTGVSPFRSFISRRLKASAGNNWLFLSLARPSEFHYAREWGAAVARGDLRVETAFTREGATLELTSEEGLATAPGPTQRINDLLERPDVSEQLWQLLHPTMSRAGASIYICGRSGFATSVLQSLHDLFKSRSTGSPEEREQTARDAIHRLVGERRLSLEVHTDTHALDDDEPYFHASEVARHNNNDLGYWVIINRVVYDLTEFRETHPGGRRIIDAYAGMDASHGFARAHNARPEVDAQLAMYRIGRVRTPTLSAARATVATPTGPRQIDHAGAYRAWLSALNLCVEMENALLMDVSLAEQPIHRGTCPFQPTAYKTARTAETHHRYSTSYLPVLQNDTLPSLWSISRALFFPHTEANPPNSAYDATMLQSQLDAARLMVERCVGNTDSNSLELAYHVERLTTEDLRLLSAVKDALLTGVEFFERSTDAANAGPHVLDATCRAAHHSIQAYYAAASDRMALSVDCAPAASASRASNTVTAPPTTPGGHSEPTSSVSGVCPHAPPNSQLESLPVLHTVRLHCGKYWTLELDATAKLAFLSRTPVPIAGLCELEQENQALLALLQPETSTYGLVVDTRHAPARNDGNFETSMASLRRGVTRHFARTAVLLASHLGELQVSRLGRNDGHDVLATQSESNALNYARGGR